MSFSKLACTFAFAAQTALAADPAEVPTPQADAAQPQHDVTLVNDFVEPTSAQARSLLPQGIAYRYGLFWAPLAGSGVELYAAAGTDGQIVLAYQGGKRAMASEMTDELEQEGIRFERFEMDGQLATIGYRKFFGGSFYGTGALGYRGLHAKYELASKANAADHLTGDVSVRSVVLNLAVGNIWTWANGFYVGGEWIGVAVPVASQFKAKTGTGIESDVELTKAQDDAVEGARRISRLPSISVATLVMGFAF